MGIVVGQRALWPERSIDAVGAVALRDAALSLALCFVVLSIAGAIGRRMLQSLSLTNLTALEAAGNVYSPRWARDGLEWICSRHCEPLSHKHKAVQVTGSTPYH